MRAEGHLHEVVAESRDSVHVVREGALGHLHRRLALGLGAIDRTWLGESKFQLRLQEVGVRASGSRSAGCMCSSR